MLQFPWVRLLVAMPFVLTGCAGMPLTTMYKLKRLDPMEADPAQIKIAIRADGRIGIRDGDAKIDIKFHSKDGSVSIDETFMIEIIRDPIMSMELVENKKPGESVTLLQLSMADAQRFRALQSTIATHKRDERKGTGSFGVGLGGICLFSPVPDDEILLDIFLQTSENDGFYVLTKELDLTKTLEKEEVTVPEWPSCIS